ncbi:hypothetical protein DUI87_19752 [Hirundo rustica rustica]|uniref:Uncharacterized protein n=1 Tax=Hirundo rustica rustica TaxID=333673 RepID=A0A3M0K8W5_HIRRU|nr:hypothetical protein DUI87_19752 [Hirundo rustica rustica]
MRPVFDKGRNSHAVGSSSTVWTLPPCQVTVRPRDRGQFWDEVKAKVEGLSGDADAGAGPAMSDVQLVPSRVPASDPVGPTGQDRAGAAASSEGLQAFPVLQGATHNTYQPLAWQALSKLRDAVGKYGLGSAKVMQVLRSFNASLLTPFDIRSLARALFPPVEYDFFENKWTQLAVRAVERNTTLGPGDPRCMVNIDMLMGTGNYTRANRQAGYEPLVQEQCQQTGMAALVQTLQLATPQQPFATIVQGIDEPFLCFARRLTAAVEKQVSDPAARKLMIQSVAQGNCNAVCKRIIEALPGEPSMSDMVGACAKISPSSQQVLSVHTAVQPALATIVQPTVATAVQPAVPAAVQPAVTAAVQPAWVVPQGVQQQQWGARARKKQRKAQKPTTVLFYCARCGRPNHAANACKATVHVNGQTLGISGNATQSAKEQLDQGHLEPSTSPWNTPVFCIKKKSGKWRLLQDLRKINAVMEGMGTLQAGMPSPTMLPADWPVLIVDLKDCFFTIPLHPDDRPKFAFMVPTINNAEPAQRYQWRVLPQGMRNSPMLCQWYVARALSGVRKRFPDAHVYHYMDDILVATPTQEELLRLQPQLLNALHSHGLQVAPEKVQQQPPWKYLGVKILERTIRHQEVQFVQSVKTLNDAQKLVSVITWLRPYLGLTTAQLSPLFELLKGDTDLKSPRELTPEARKVLEEVQQAVSACQVYRIEPSIDVTVFITTPDLHPTALWCAIQARVHPYYVLHVRSHTNLPGFVAEGNARADKLANPAWVAPQPDVLAQAKASHGFFHQNAHTLQKQFQLTATEARKIVESCDDCHALGAPLPAGVNPRGLKALKLWQTDVTQVAEFGRLKYVHVTVDTFSSAMWASAHTGEKARDVIAHWRQAFAVLGIPSAVKTDNGPAYASQQASDSEQQPRAKGLTENFAHFIDRLPQALTNHPGMDEASKQGMFKILAFENANPKTKSILAMLPQGAEVANMIDLSLRAEQGQQRRAIAKAVAAAIKPTTNVITTAVQKLEKQQLPFREKGEK